MAVMGLIFVKNPDVDKECDLPPENLVHLLS
jgi:hypothetical protein